jgi:uncharacterized membrane protein
VLVTVVGEPEIGVTLTINLKETTPGVEAAVHAITPFFVAGSVVIVNHDDISCEGLTNEYVTTLLPSSGCPTDLGS